MKREPFSPVQQCFQRKIAFSFGTLLIVPVCGVVLCVCVWRVSVECVFLWVCARKDAFFCFFLMFGELGFFWFFFFLVVTDVGKGREKNLLRDVSVSGLREKHTWIDN